MGIKVACGCGKRFQVMEDVAGRKVRCPACQDLVRVPGERKEDEGYGLTKVRRCPECKTNCDKEAVICVNCGWNFETGRKMKTRYKRIERSWTVGIPWVAFWRRLTMVRETDGDLMLRIKLAFFFLPLSSHVVDLSEYNTLATDVVAGDGESPDVYYAYLEGPGLKPVCVFSSADEEQWREVVDVLQESGKLTVTRR